jgi:hypothetical protein
MKGRNMSGHRSDTAGPVGDAVQGSPEPPPTVEALGAVTVPTWTDPENAPTERASIAEDPTGESNSDGGGEPASDLALGWDVSVSGPYTLSVDDVPTTQLDTTSTLQEIEVALNETSGPVGLDVSGDPASTFSVSTDTPAKLTGNGATVTVTQGA